ncbi:thiamine phosphate synthase [Candidatus Pelagibacter sp.]|nr:thiamine phosphate synthase [Candidatus Pelagibacter sp.]
MKYNRKKFIYLISPSKINNAFYNNLYKVLRSKKVSFFQLRLKKESFERKYTIGKKIKKICNKFNVKFLINDDVLLTKKLNADGCHLGQKDMNIFKARKIIGDKIIGITCHNSIKLAKIAIINKADYIALGAFNYSKTKRVKYKATINLLKKVRKITKTQIVAIGGINSKNYKKLLLNKANFLAISSYIWKNKKLKPFDAIQKLK